MLDVEQCKGGAQRNGHEHYFYPDGGNNLHLSGLQVVLETDRGAREADPEQLDSGLNRAAYRGGHIAIAERFDPIVI